MQNHLERTPVAVSQRMGVFVLCLLFIAEVCTVLAGAVDPNLAGAVDLAGAVAPNGVRAGGSAALVPAMLGEKAISTLAGFAMAERGEGLCDQFTSEIDGKRAYFGVTGSNEDNEERQHGETPAPSKAAGFAPARGTSPRRPDPIVELCCVVVTPARGPPAFARTFV